MATHADTEIDIFEEASVPVNEAAAVNSTGEEIVFLESEATSGGASGSFHGPDSASEDSSDFRFASISDDSNSPQHVSIEMSDMCAAGSDTEESINGSETEEVVSAPGSRVCRRRCLVVGVFLLLMVLMIALGIGLAILAYADLGDDLSRPITYLGNAIDDTGEFFR